MSDPLLTEKTVIWEGRFQPVHKGHLRYIERLLDTGREVLVYMVHNERASDEQLEAGPVRFFSEEVNKHHGNEKNPLPFGIRYKMLCDAVRSYFGDEPRLYIWGGRRMDLVWDYIKIMLPSRRVFFTPTRDAFEDIKAGAWAVLGEEVVRVDTSDIEKISATMVRGCRARRISGQVSYEMHHQNFDGKRSLEFVVRGGRLTLFLCKMSCADPFMLDSKVLA